MASDKSSQTRSAIIDCAVHMARRDGMAGLCMSKLARAMHMSRSGIFARVGGLDCLKNAVLLAYRPYFEDRVMLAGAGARPGLARLRVLFESSVRHVMAPERCLYIDAVLHGLPHSEVACASGAWRRAFEAEARAALVNGELAAPADPAQVAFELFGQLLALACSMRAGGACPVRALDAYAHIVRGCAPAPAAAARTPCPEPPFRWPAWLLADASSTKEDHHAN